MKHKVASIISVQTAGARLLFTLLGKSRPLHITLPSDVLVLFCMLSIV